MAMQQKLWTISALEVELPPTRRTLAKYLAEVEPAKTKGREKYYKLADVLKAIPGNLLGITAGGKGDDERLDINAETARRTKAQADKLELEVGELEGRLVATEVVEETWVDLVTAFRAKLLGMPSALAAQVVGVDVQEAQKLIKEQVIFALDELQNYDPNRKSKGPGKAGRKGSGPTA